MKQNRLKSLKICQGITYKRLLEASGFSKRYGIFFGHTETVSYTSVSLHRQQMIEATVNIAYLVKESPRQLLAPISHQRQVLQLNRVTVTVDDLHIIMRFTSQQLDIHGQTLTLLSVLQPVHNCHKLIVCPRNCLAWH